ncbi:MAG TPA: hypothetical protein VFN03_12265, partial [Trueperaceae bacterium]|nr:hypothetical protein [Trueperaceae bacterium]
MKPSRLRTAGFLLSISPATLAAAVALTAGRRVLSHVAPAVLVSLALFATASLFSRSVDWTLLVGVASIGIVLAGARSRPGLAPDQAGNVWQGVVAGLYLLALLAALQVSPVAEPLFQALDGFVEPVVDRFGLDLNLWPLELPGRASLWTLHPNLLGASVLVPALAAMTLRRSIVARLVVLVPSLGLVALTGSRSALLGLGVGILVLLVGDAVREWRAASSTAGERAGGPVRVVSPRGRVLVLILVLGILTVLLLLLVPGLRGRIVPRG